MPYLILVAGVLIGIYAFLRFVSKASPAEIKHFFLTLFFGIYALFLLFFALSERIGVAIVLLLCSIPFIINHYRNKAKARKALPAPENKV